MLETLIRKIEYINEGITVRMRNEVINNIEI